MLKVFLLFAMLSIPAFTIAEGPKDAAPATAPAETNATAPANNAEKATDAAPVTSKAKAATSTGTLLAKRKTATKDRVRDSFRPPALKMESLNDELMRAASENKTQSDRLAEERVKIEQERAALNAEREELKALLKKIEAARTQLKAETLNLEHTLEKNEEELAELKKARKINAQQLRAITESECTKGKKDEAEGGTAATVAAPTGGRIKSLSKALRNMKPKQAAQLLKSLDRDIAVELLRRMPARQAGAVLGSMKPAAAAMLATDLATDPDTGEVLQ
ncbi:MAG: hypothetical protein CMH56_12785 [Myxococcales bacterium]|nr:hypothetical protein [Myxococcales bacterium]